MLTDDSATMTIRHLHMTDQRLIRLRKRELELR